MMAGGDGATDPAHEETADTANASGCPSPGQTFTHGALGSLARPRGTNPIVRDARLARNGINGDRTRPPGSVPTLTGWHLARICAVRGATTAGANP